MILLGDKHISAVLFDLDGTLVRTHIDFDRMYAEVWAIADAEGLPHEVTAGKQVLEGIDSAVTHVGGSRGARMRERMWAAIERVERAGCAQPAVIPGANELFEKLKGLDVRVGVVTRNCKAMSTELLDRFGLAVDVLLTRDDVAVTKPHPSHLHAALDAMQRPVSESVMIGDHWLDVVAGIRAGCSATIGVAGARDRSWFDAHPPTYIVKDLTEAVALFHTEAP